MPQPSQNHCYPEGASWLPDKAPSGWLATDNNGAPSDNSGLSNSDGGRDGACFVMMERWEGGLMVQPNDQWRTWDGAAVEKPDGGRQAEWSDSAPSNFLPLPWTHCAADTFGKWQDDAPVKSLWL